MTANLVEEAPHDRGGQSTNCPAPKPDLHVKALSLKTHYDRLRIMKQTTTDYRPKNDAAQALTKIPCNRRNYLFLTLLFNFLLVGTAHAKGLAFPEVLHRSKFDHINDIWYDSHQSPSPQLILKIDPPHQNRVHIYGVGKDADSNRTQTFLTGPSGYLGIDGYKDGSTVCFVVLRNGPDGNELSWYEDCHHLDDDEDSQESLDIDLDTLPEPVQISTQLTSTLDRPPISLQDLPIRLRLVSPTDLSQIHHSYSNYEHQAYATLIGDDVGKVKVKTNKDLKGFIAVDLSNHLTSGEVSFLISKNNSLDIDLKVDCQITPESPQLGSLQSWSQSLGWFPTIPSTAEEADRKSVV